MKDHPNIINKTFFRLLPIQVMIVAMGSINSIVDGVIAGQFIDATSVGVIGLYYSMVNALNAIGAVCLGGTAVLIGKYMGQANTQKTKGVFSLNIAFTSAIGIFITAASLFFSGPLAKLLGASPELMSPLITYIRGYAIGILPLLLGQQVAAFLQLELQSKRTYIGIIAMIVSNVVLNVLLVAVFKLGIFGLALSTSICNWIYFLILGIYYISPKAQLQFDRKNIPLGEIKDMVRIGLPGATLVFALSVRGIVINRILLAFAGSDGLSAMSAFSMINGLLIAFCMGTGAVVRMLASVFIGEENPSAIKQLMKIAYTRGLPMSGVIMVVVILLSGTIASIFFPDKASAVHAMTQQLTIIYAFCIPLILVCIVNANYLQAWGHNVFVNILSVVDGFLSMVIPSLILAPIMGAMGVWLAHPIGIVITALMTPLYCLIYWKHPMQNMDEVLFLPPHFGAKDEDRLDRVIKNTEEVVAASSDIHDVAAAHNIDEKIANYSALCLEEIASNVIAHGFTHDNKNHSLEVNVVIKDDIILLRVKDDCIPFNPEERWEMVSPEDPLKNIGIRLVHQLADDITYQNLIGLNILTMKINLKKENN